MPILVSSSNGGRCDTALPRNSSIRGVAYCPVAFSIFTQICTHAASSTRNSHPGQPNYTQYRFRCMSTRASCPRIVRFIQFSTPLDHAAPSFFSFSRFFRPLVLLGNPLADRFDLRLVEEPTLRTFFAVVVAAASSSRFCAASSSAQSGFEGILPMSSLSVSSLCRRQHSKAKAQ